MRAHEIYKAYRIMPSLQTHQLRVAAAGKMIADHFSGGLDTRSIILACLFHDMGNIIKSDLTVFPDFVEPEGLAYWQKVKDEFVAKYGQDHHQATEEIAHEIGLPEKVLELLETGRFGLMERICQDTRFEKKIYEYADMRAGPRGVLPLRERAMEGRQRYLKRVNFDGKSEEEFQRLLSILETIEKQIFERCSIKPEDITDAGIASLIPELRNYPVA